MNVTQWNSLRARVGVAVAAFVLLAAGAAWADPPARVVRLAYASGAVSFLPAGDNDWVQAAINRPLWTGDQLWTAAGARAELQMGNAALRLAPETSLSIVNFDDRTEQFQVNQGAVNLYVRSMEGAIEIDTPNLAFSIRGPGQYRVDVSADATTVAVYRGEAEAFGTQAAYVINAGERFSFRGTDLNDYQPVAIAERDAFDGWVAQRVSLQERSVSARYVSPDVIGYADLDANGTWSNVPTYGAVWVPRGVAADWAPYRYGHWAWIDPWGWTWVDDASWGFAPFHYGRWAFVQSRWCWVPGPRHERPVYAPALVAFVGGSNFGASVSLGAAGGVAWFPLGPGEVYRPGYNVSREYFTRVNVTNTVVNVTNVTNVYNNPTQTNIRYANIQTANAVTAVPTQAFVDARPVQRAAVKVDARTIQQAGVVAAVAVAPVRTSIVGAGAPAQARPNATVMERAVIARQAPPPAPPSIQQREDALKRQPGKPLDAAELQKIAPQNVTARPNVKVVQPTGAAKPLPATARAPEKGAPQPAAPAAAGEQRGQPPVAGGAPPKADERREGPPQTAVGSEKQGPPGARPEAKGPPSATRAPGAPAPMQEARPHNVPPGVPPPETTARQAPGAPEPLRRPGAPPKEGERGAPPTASAPAVTPPQAARAPTAPTPPQGLAPQRPETANAPRPPPRESAGQPPSRPENANVKRPPTAQAPPQRPETANAPRPAPREAAEPSRGQAAAPQPPRPESANVQRPPTAQAPPPRPPTTQAPPQRPETANAPRPVPRESAQAPRGPAATAAPRPEATNVQRPAPVAQVPAPQAARPAQSAAPAQPPQQSGRQAEKSPPQKGPPEKDKEKQKEEDK